MVLIVLHTVSRTGTVPTPWPLLDALEEPMFVSQKFLSRKSLPFEVFLRQKSRLERLRLPFRRQSTQAIFIWGSLHSIVHQRLSRLLRRVVIWCIFPFFLFIRKMRNHLGSKLRIFVNYPSLVSFNGEFVGIETLIPLLQDFVENCLVLFEFICNTFEWLHSGV